MPKVSVIIPVYNVEAYLRQCMDSVVNQTLRDIEIICVDDGSTDGSAAILQEYAAKDCRIKVIPRAHTNAGEARNAGMAVGSGEYLGFVDSDDWCEPTLFEQAYARAKADDADLVFWRHREYDDSSKKVKREAAFGLPTNIEVPFDGSELGEKVFSIFNFAPWNRIARRDFVQHNQLSFQQIERSNDVGFGCLALATASRISVVDEVLYNYRARTAGSLQTENDKTPLSIVEAWEFLVGELMRRGVIERYRRGVALASMYCFVRTLDVLAERKNEYVVLFDALKTLFGQDPFFATVQPDEISNDIMANALRMIRGSDSASAFSMRWASDVYKWMTKFYREREAARRELNGVKRDLWDMQEQRQEEAERRRLPGVSLIVVAGDDCGRASFASHIENASIVDREIVYVDDISESMLDGVTKDYVVIVGGNDRYINDYALELLVNTAKFEKADVVGGMMSDASVRSADFVFDSGWLRENRGLVSILRNDDQAFIAAALARARKHVVEKRVYTEYVRSASSPLVSVVVPAHNAGHSLDRCIGSLVSQAYRNLEIIVVDDGSTDSTASICDAWAEKDSRIRIVHRQNGGLSSTRNAGMSAARGKYIGFVDSCDYVDVEMFGSLATALESHRQCDVAKCGLAEWAGNALRAEPVKGETRPGYDIVDATDALPGDKLYRADFLRANGIKFPEGEIDGAEAFFFSVFSRVRNCFYLPQRHYHRLGVDEATAEQRLKSYEFAAELLGRDNRRDLLGVLYRRMAEYVRGFAGAALEDFVCDGVSRVLWRTHAFYYADLIFGSDRQEVQRQVYELMNRLQSDGCGAADLSVEWMPRSLAQDAPSKQPLVSFIVPVYNAEKYLAGSLETLRRQTLPDFEVVCIDDGSIDDSGKILDFYANADPRIRVWHVENGGVSNARNLGLGYARGRYVAFFDGDDRLHPHMAARTVLTAALDDLDAVMFDFRCFAYDSLAPVDHSWRLARHIADFPQDRVFSPAELDRLSVYGSSCTFLWNLAFLRSTGEAFPGIKLGEDLVWVLSVISRVQRMRVLNVPFYGYRRGNPSSAVSRLQTGEGDPPVQLLGELSRVVSGVRDHGLQTLMLGRIVSDIVFQGEKSPKVRTWLRDGGFGAIGMERLAKAGTPRQSARLAAMLADGASDAKPDIEHFISQAPGRIQRLMHEAMVARQGKQKDLVIVAGQLNSTTNEPIDSWTFFRWLQDHGVPCRYVVWRKHCMVERMRADNGLKDVILLSGNGVDNYEFIERCRDLLPRLLAVVMENTVLNQLTWRFFHMLDGCHYVFLQHGVMFWKMASNIAKTCSVANYINVASEAEQRFLEEYVPEHWDTGRKPGYLVAGLPRWDILQDRSQSEREEVVFFMPTWRAAFNSGMDAIAKSAYFSGVRALVSRENIDRLKKRGVRLIMAAHHHLVNHVSNLDFDLPIELVPTSKISYWISHASLCITDYSSVCFDFLFLNKPCIFWTPDRYDGLLQGNGYAEVVFAEHQGKNMFNRVRSAAEVVAMVEKYADSGFVLEPEKRVISDRYFSCRKDICERLYSQIRAIDEKDVVA